MAEHDETRDPRISAGYRALGDERPPEALDAAILAASRRAVGAGPRRAGASRMRRWALPVSVAAVVVLTLSLVVRVQLERPDLESPLPAPAALPPAAEKPARDAKDEVAALAKRNEIGKTEPKAKTGTPEPASAERERDATRAPAAPAAAPAAAPPARQFVPEPPAPKAPPAKSVAESSLGAARAPAPPSVAEGRAIPGLREDAAAAGRVASSAALEDRAQAAADVASKKDESPRDWLERIARLRREGRVKDADDSLAEFRKRYPDYEIPKEMREAVLGEAGR